jgi:hypothetical protein
MLFGLLLIAPAAGAAPPAATGTPTLSGVTHQQVVIKARAIPADADSVIYLCDGVRYGAKAKADSSASSFKTGLTPNTEYAFTTVAKNADGESAASTALNVTTDIVLAPVLAEGETGSDEISVDVSKVYANADSIQFYIDGAYVAAITKADSAAGYTFTDLIAETEYDLTAKARGGTWLSEASNTVTVTTESTEAQVVTAITLAPADTTLAVGDTLTVAVTVLDQFGETMIGETIVWTSSDEEVATIVDGFLTAVSGGAATITAADGEVDGEVDVTVLATPSIASGEVTPIGIEYEITVSESSADSTIVYDAADDSVLARLAATAESWLRSVLEPDTEYIVYAKSKAGGFLSAASEPDTTSTEVVDAPVIASTANTTTTITYGLTISDEDADSTIVYDSADDSVLARLAASAVSWERFELDPDTGYIVYAKTKIGEYESAASTPDTTSTEARVVTALVLLPAKVTLGSGGVAEFEVTVLDQDDVAMTGETVVWTITNGTAGEEADGVYTVTQGITETVTAAVGEVTDTATVRYVPYIRVSDGWDEQGDW